MQDERKARMEATLNRVVLDGLPPVLMGVVILYVVYSLLYWFRLPREELRLLGPAALSSVAIALGLRLALDRFNLSESWAHPIATGIVALLVMNVCLRLYVTKEAHQALSLLPLTSGIGVFFLSTPWFLFALVMTLGGWFLATYLADMVGIWADHSFAVVAAVLVSSVIHVVRGRNIRRITLLRMQDEEHRAALQKALVAERESAEQLETVLRFLRESEERFRSIFTYAPIGIAVLNREGIILETNRELSEMLRQSEEAMEGTHFTDYIEPEEIERSMELFETLVRGETHYYEGECRYRRDDAAPHWGFRAVSGVYDPDGRFQYAIAMIVDITEQKEGELALRRAKEEAERASRAKSEFLSQMSHELRTPLNAILGFAQLLEIDPALDASRQQQVGQIVRAGRHLLALIDEILDLSRIESGQFTLSLEPVAVGDLVEEVLEAVRPLAERRSVRLLNPVVPPSLPLVLVDPARLRQVLLNLITNAIQYNRASGSVSVLCHRIDDGQVQVDIIDTGRGIAEDDQEDLFEPFNRLGVENSTIPGAGVGLTIAKQLVEAMNGTIGLESELDKGSRFFIRLPVASSPASSA